ncbi:MAG: hypothetical protein F6K19_15530 [Cyanothece sp. SIO1E1]|nr:hypothetical protein [Cyanothece sp. SIO1E1]
MSIRKVIRVTQSLFRQIWQLAEAITKGFITQLLRLLYVSTRPANWSRQSGFVLPTVVMVTLVITLLVTAVLIRSFDRTKNARNVRVDEVTLEAAAPAIERAEAKLETLFQDPTLPRSTPSDAVLFNRLSSNDARYNFTDETRLTLAYDFGDGIGNIIPNGNGNIDTSAILEQNETINTAWRFPADTDNNGLFDSFTLYGILFRSPERDPSGIFKGPRTPLDARTPPQDQSVISGICAGALGTSANLVTEAGWYKAGNDLKKSFYVYTATVPITDTTELGLGSDYENYSGTAGFSALEYQQDRARTPLVSNAVVFEDDLAIISGTDLFLNGSVVTNSNLFLSPANAGARVRLYQVSSPDSCFYSEENSKITVGGNVINAPPLDANYDNSNPADVHLFRTGAVPDLGQNITNANQSATTAEIPQNVLYNSQAYEARISHLVNAWTTTNPGAPSLVDPQEIQDAVNAEPDPGKRLAVRIDELEDYFEDRVRRVSFEEVGLATPEIFASPNDDPQGTGDFLRPPIDWMFPVDPANGTSEAGFAGITLNIAGGNVRPAATEPATLANDTQENSIGDRVLLGNNLPATWYQINDYGAYNTDNTGLWVQSEAAQVISGTTWDLDTTPPTDSERARFTRVQSLADVGDTDRNGFWEEQAASEPQNALDGIGGLRVITGAGVYERRNSFLPPPTYDDPSTPTVETDSLYDDPLTTAVTEEFPIVWPDTMPMSPGLNSEVFDNSTATWVPLPAPLDLVNSPADTNTIDPNTPKYAKGDLRMRAAAVYHYAQDVYNPSSGDFLQAPIACVSSYYDPTNSQTAQNSTAGSFAIAGADDVAKSNNGISYPPPTTTSAGLSGVTAPDSATGLFPGDENATTLIGRLYHQANLVFPTGRFVNEPLRNALTTLSGGGTLSLSEQASIDSSICSLQIVDGTLSASSSVIPNNAIREIAFLDSRQIEAIDADDPATTEVESFATLTGNYDLEIEERQPLEVRVTQLDLDELRRQTITFLGGITGPSPEYLLPNSGIIYASRDDALPDLSDPLPNDPTTVDKANQLAISPVDYRLDPTRRPSGIMVFNGKKLARNDSETFRESEKGLILVSNLPAYVWGWADEDRDGTAEDSIFNPHSVEEFTENLNLTVGGALWDNFYTRGLPFDQNFACRPGDPRLPTCTTGDTWRAAVTIADSMTLLSRNFQFGFRTDGDYDLRNNNSGNQGSITRRRDNGFYANNYVTSRDFIDETYSVGTGYDNVADGDGDGLIDGSSYFNNFVTPVQRRVEFPEYVMEICRKLPVSECDDDDWVVGIDNGNGVYEPANPDEVQTATQVVGESGAQLLSGTTARAALDPNDRRYPRRVAFRREADNTLSESSPGRYVPIGIDGSGNVAQFNFPTRPPATTNALWFAVADSGADPNTILLDGGGNPDHRTNRPLFYPPLADDTIPGVEPLLAPILQLQTVRGTTFASGVNVGVTKWQQPAEETTFNLVTAVGNTPARPGEPDGGVANFLRLLENWDDVNARVAGSLMEFDRSAYATGPFQPLLATLGTNAGIFNYLQTYKTDNSGGRIPFLEPPNRLFGFDVGLLSQIPDLFSSRFTLPSPGAPNEFFREANRDDDWVQTLLCARISPTNVDNAINSDQRPANFCSSRSFT